MRLGVLSGPLLVYFSSLAVFYCAHASTVVQIADTLIPDLLPTFSSEAFTPKYVVAVQNANTQDVGLEGVLPMKDKYGRSYSCVIPDATSPDTQAQGALSLKDGEQNMQKAPSELLSALDSLCLYRIEDWWTYELCYKKHVRQFHKDAENAMSEYDLGQYDEDRSDLDTILDNGTLTGASSKYVRQVYAGGEACDITGKLRETEVHFVCSEEGKEGIKSIREHATCQYTLVFATPWLCKHPGFQIPKQPVHTIVCSRPGGSQQEDNTVPAQPQEMEQEAEGEDEGGVQGDVPIPQNKLNLEDEADLTNALQAGGPNVSAFEAASGDSGRRVEAEADESSGHGQQERRNSGGKEGSEAGKPSSGSRGAEDVGKRDRKSSAPETSGAVGPPSPAGSRPAGKELFYEDNEVDEEADLEVLEEEDDEVDFSRTGQISTPIVDMSCIGAINDALNDRWPYHQCPRRRILRQNSRQLRTGVCCGAVKSMPIFPLNCVSFPSSAMPLNIFEARYRVLFNTLLYTPGAEDLEEGLVQTESPFAGTRQFGMCWTDSKGAIAAIGTTLEIKSHVLLEDGRMGIETIGRERFRILSVKQEKPVLVCEIELLDEDDDTSTQLIQQADEVRELFRTLIQLHTKRGKVKPEDAEQYEPEELRQLGPRNLSFWIASNFRETPQQQQILLQENSTAQRLEYEKKVLEGSVNYLRAKLAVEGALAPDSAGNEEQPPSSD